MIRSMTGFGKEAAEIGNKKFSIEVKSLNSKQLDLNVRIPGLYKEKELEIRSMAASKLERGKVDVLIYYEALEDERSFELNRALIKKYYEDVKGAAEEAGMDNLDQADFLTVVMRMPEIMKTERQEMDEEEWKVLKDVIERAMDNMNNFRVEEGLSLEKDFTERIQTIEKLLAEIEVYEGERIEIVKDRTRKNLEGFMKDEKVDRNRFEQELIYYMEKLDISEEKVRLRQHCQYFMETVGVVGANGKKLGFITQEIGREINTIGSKANHAEIQQRVVLMKDELEKVKEQVLNVL